MTPIIVPVESIVPTPWRNGGGTTRELCAWPSPQDWILRISVAEILASGPFSAFPGIDRWFAVLSGGAIRLETAGSAAREFTARDVSLQVFSGDASTHCTALGAATRDFNVMLRRARARLAQQPLSQCPKLETSAALIALFATAPVTVVSNGDATCRLPGMALAWWHNPRREPLALRATATAVRGWWLEVNADP